MASDTPSAPPKYDPVGDHDDNQQQRQQGVVQQQPVQFEIDPYRVGYNQPSGAQVMVTNVITNQPVSRELRTWSTSLCGCCEDMTSCCLVAWCAPCYLCCSLSPRMGESCCAPICLSMCGHSVPLVYRTKIRAAHGIAGGAIDDCCVSSCFSMPCALCQMKRELDYIERVTGKPAFRMH